MKESPARSLQKERGGRISMYGMEWKRVAVRDVSRFKKDKNRGRKLGNNWSCFKASADQIMFLS